MKGYMGKILFVNLTTGDIEERLIPDHIYEMLLSGVGLGAYVLYNEIPAGADPLGPENVLGIVSGLLTGTGSFMTGRWMVVCKSPLTGGWGDANCGGTLHQLSSSADMMVFSLPVFRRNRYICWSIIKARSSRMLPTSGAKMPPSEEILISKIRPRRNRRPQ